MQPRGSVEVAILSSSAALAVASVYQLVTPTEAKELSELAVVFVLATLVQWAVVADSIEGIHPLRALLRAIITGCAAVPVFCGSSTRS
jgi:hypothetical protein